MKDSQQSVITFKPVSGPYEPYCHPYVGSQTIEAIKEILMGQYGVDFEQIKLISKGKVLQDRETAEQTKIQGKVVMLVISRKAEKKKQNTDHNLNKISSPNSLNTGMGATSPIGFGNYSIINHPQYASAMAGAVDQENLEDIMNDPNYQGMMEDMMNDPDTLKQLLEDNPMFRNMIKENPNLKMVMDNPALMKMVFNKDTIKIASEMMKKGNNGEQISPMPTQPPNFQPGAMGMPQMPNMGLMGQIPNPNNPFGFQPGQQPNGFSPFAMGMGNPLLLNMWNQQQINSNVPANPQTSQSIEQKYKQQLKELESMGFRDRELNIKALIESKGDVDGAIERLCED